MWVHQVSAAALALFQYGQAQARQRGLLLVDTKYEFGLDAGGQIRLVDEVHTPDSSRHGALGLFMPNTTYLQTPRSCMLWTGLPLLLVSMRCAACCRECGTLPLFADPTN